MLSSLKPELDKKGVALVGVAHETKGVEEFKPFLKGEIYLDEKKKFYGPLERWENVLVGFLRVQTWSNFFRARGGGFSGNLEGEGRLLGGVFVVGPADQGVLFEHREKVWGDHADLKDVRAAVENIKTSSNDS